MPARRAAVCTAGRGGILGTVGTGQVEPATARLEVALMEVPHTLDVPDDGLDEPFGEHGHTVASSVPAPHDDFASLGIHVRVPLRRHTHAPLVREVAQKIRHLTLVHLRGVTDAVEANVPADSPDVRLFGARAEMSAAGAPAHLVEKPDP